MDAVTPAFRFALWLGVGFIVGFGIFWVMGERYHAERSVLLRDRWTGKLFKLEGVTWVEVK